MTTNALNEPTLVEEISEKAAKDFTVPAGTIASAKEFAKSLDLAKLGRPDVSCQDGCVVFTFQEGSRGIEAVWTSPHDVHYYRWEGGEPYLVEDAVRAAVGVVTNWLTRKS